MYINGTSFKYHKILYISSFYHLLHQPAMNLIWFQSFFELLSFTLQKKNITVRKKNPFWKSGVIIEIHWHL